MDRVDSVNGVILAGGRSKRMGTDKALIPIHGKPMIQHVAETLQSVFKTVLVASDFLQRYEFLGFAVIPDEFKDSGPLAGIQAALKISAPAAVFVLPCDMPFFPSDLVTYLLAFESNAPVRVLSTPERSFPLCGYYSQSALPMITRSLEKGDLRMTNVLHDLSADLVPPPRTGAFSIEMLRNLNSSFDLGA